MAGWQQETQEENISIRYKGKGQEEMRKNALIFPAFTD